MWPGPGGLAEGQGRADQSPRKLGLQCRYALITASINSLAEHIPITLLTVLVTEGYWDTAKGLFYARQITSKLSRAQCGLLAPHLTPEERDRVLAGALAAARTLGGRAGPGPVAAILAPRLTPAAAGPGAGRGAGRGAGARGRGGPGPGALSLAPRSDAGIAGPGAGRGAGRGASASGDEWARSERWPPAPHPTPGSPAEAWPRLRAIGDEGARAWALAALAPT